jgi:hypothetical protein
MAIVNEEVRQIGAGVMKTINEGAMSQVLDTLQRYQYSYPVKSTTRELVSNAVDSLADKRTARKILSGEATVTDFFVEREGALYTDSHWNPEYYDLDWLDEVDEVEIRYVSGMNMEKDYVTISDTGVGLGGKRLEGFFSLGFSTKRLSKLPIGKWGIGAKSPLSVGVDFYTVESRYNGQLYRFNVYAHSVDSLIPRFNLEKGVENPHIVWNEDTEHEYKVYYENTEKKNGVVVTIAAKKIHKAQYIDAVKSQLLYFDDLKFVVVDESGHEAVIPYKAPIVYEDDFIILSDQTYYSKPHLLLNKVNYGYIDWAELELEDRNGNIGIKVAPENIDVTPSRENIIWSDRTKQMIHERFEKVQEIASKFIQEELKETDFILWLKTCYQATGRYSGASNSMVGRLSRIIDITTIKPAYNPNPEVKYRMDLLTGLYIRTVNKISKSMPEGMATAVQRVEAKTLNALFDSNNHRPIYLLEAGERVSNKKDKYLLETHTNGFIQISESSDRLKMIASGIPEEVVDKMLSWESKSAFGVSARELWDLIKASSVPLKYADIEVPESYSKSDEEFDMTSKYGPQAEEVMAKRQEVRSRMVAAKSGKIFIRPYRSIVSVPNSAHVTVEEINDWDCDEIYYAIGTDEQKQGHLATHVAYNPSTQALDEDVMIISIAPSDAKHFVRFQPITEFFLKIKNSTISMSNSLIRWNTARLIEKDLEKAHFLRNFQDFNPDMAEKADTLRVYVNAHYHTRSVSSFAPGTTAYQDLINHLTLVTQFQVFVIDNKDNPELIAAKAGKFFGNKEITDGCAVDVAMMDLLDEVMEYCNVLGGLLNYIPDLTVPNASIHPALAQEISLYVELKGLTYVPPPTDQVALPENQVVPLVDETSTF